MLSLYCNEKVLFRCFLKFLSTKNLPYFFVMHIKVISLSFIQITELLISQAQIFLPSSPLLSSPVKSSQP